MAQDPTDANIIYSGGAVSNGSDYFLAISKSTNGGVSWATPWQPLTKPSHCYDLAVAPSNPQVLYAAGYRGASDYASDTNPLVLRSANGGPNWSDVTGNLADLVGSRYSGDSGKLAINCAFAHPASEDYVLAGAQSGAFASRNGGQSWFATSLTAAVTGFNYDPLTKAIFAATDGAGVYYSRDQGLTWLPLNEGLENQSCSCIAIDPVNRYLFVGTGYNGVWRAPIVLPNGVDGRTWSLFE